MHPVLSIKTPPSYSFPSEDICAQINACYEKEIPPSKKELDSYSYLLETTYTANRNYLKALEHLMSLYGKIGFSPPESLQKLYSDREPLEIPTAEPTDFASPTVFSVAPESQFDQLKKQLCNQWDSLIDFPSQENLYILARLLQELFAQIPPYTDDRKAKLVFMQEHLNALSHAYNTNFLEEPDFISTLLKQNTLAIISDDLHFFLDQYDENKLIFSQTTLDHYSRALEINYIDIDLFHDCAQNLSALYTILELSLPEPLKKLAITKSYTDLLLEELEKKLTELVSVIEIKEFIASPLPDPPKIPKIKDTPLLDHAFSALQFCVNAFKKDVPAQKRLKLLVYEKLNDIFFKLFNALLPYDTAVIKKRVEIAYTLYSWSDPYLKLVALAEIVFCPTKPIKNFYKELKSLQKPSEDDIIKLIGILQRCIHHYTASQEELLTAFNCLLTLCATCGLPTPPQFSALKDEIITTFSV